MQKLAFLICEYHKLSTKILAYTVNEKLFCYLTLKLYLNLLKPILRASSVNLFGKFYYTQIEPLMKQDKWIIKKPKLYIV